MKWKKALVGALIALVAVVVIFGRPQHDQQGEQAVREAAPVVESVSWFAFPPASVGGWVIYGLLAIVLLVALVFLYRKFSGTALTRTVPKEVWIPAALIGGLLILQPILLPEYSWLTAERWRYTLAFVVGVALMYGLFLAVASYRSSRPAAPALVRAAQTTAQVQTTTSWAKRVSWVVLSAFLFVILVWLVELLPTTVPPGVAHDPYIGRQLLGCVLLAGVLAAVFVEYRYIVLSRKLILAVAGLVGLALVASPYWGGVQREFMPLVERSGSSALGVSAFVAALFATFAKKSSYAITWGSAVARGLVVGVATLIFFLHVLTPAELGAYALGVISGDIDLAQTEHIWMPLVILAGFVLLWSESTKWLGVILLFIVLMIELL